MARPAGSSRQQTDVRFESNRAGRDVDPAPGDDRISGERADYAPRGADPEPTAGGTLKRLVKEIGQDDLTDWAAALTYYGVLALFPAVIALVSIAGLVFSPAQITSALTSLLEQIAPGTSAQSFTGVIEQVAGSGSAAGFGLILGLAGALFSASAYVGAFTRAANVIWETPEGRPIWKLKPLQMLITLIGVVLAAVLIGAVIISGPVVDALGSALGLGSTAQTVWSIAKWPVMAAIVAIMIALLYYMTPNVRQRGFRWVSPGAGVAILVFVVASALFAFYVANFGSYNATYGALAGVVVFLVWFWLTNLSLLIGAELDSEIERTKELKDGVPRAEKEIQLDARQDPKPQQTT
ncbi:YihY/virulence factor BrkB family protein [Geodermatophilus sp. YIM 151500]|uniref:YihY/virulence factor BrkB family protein n=1 Tax=Geodermatophilus sp. YIM 151500 TaxID=2984531 RepID=UPI0021E39152|nr:YihY/virulence factor BrkB family protein [Geodermatophilus sp. YIM 151500]MCV2490331.1 YihY/virulence factor BrkB family protein [Geodermatophilus sp. YIM 151500]